MGSDSCLVLGAGNSAQNGGDYYSLASVFLVAYIAMIPEVDGDSTPSGQRPFACTAG